MRLGRRAQIFAAGLLIVASRIATVRAASPDPSEDFFRTGVRLYDAKDFSSASDAFAQAYATSPKEKYLWNAVIAELRAKRFFAALVHLKLYKHAPDASVERRAGVDELITKARAHVGRLTIEAPTGLEVSVDGVAIGKSPLGEPVDVDPAVDHEVTADGASSRWAGHVVAPGEASVTVTLQERPAPARAPLEPESELPPWVDPPRDVSAASTPPPRSSMTTRNVVVLAAGGVALATAAVGVVFSLQAQNDRNKADSFRAEAQAAAPGVAPMSICHDQVSESCAGLANAIQQNISDTNTATILYETAAGVGAAALITFFVWPRPKGAPLLGRLIPEFDGHGARLGVEGAF